MPKKTAELPGKHDQEFLGLFACLQGIIWYTLIGEFPTGEKTWMKKYGNVCPIPSSS